MFKKAFGTGTALLWEILFSDSIGGDFNPKSEDFIYITAWNRASFGCEALLSYHHSDAPALAVYDHVYGAFTCPPQPISLFQQYVVNKVVGGIDVRSITLLNVTYREEDGWVNDVSLISERKGQSFRLYRSPKPCRVSASAQKTEFWFDGSCGPTVEPSRIFTGTSPIGWANARLSRRDEAGKWTEYQLLSEGQSTIEPGCGCFRPRYVEPNHTALLTS